MLFTCTRPVTAAATTTALPLAIFSACKRNYVICHITSKNNYLMIDERASSLSLSHSTNLFYFLLECPQQPTDWKHHICPTSNHHTKRTYKKLLDRRFEQRDGNSVGNALKQHKCNFRTADSKSRTDFSVVPKARAPDQK